MQVRERLAERKHPMETAQHAPEHHRYRPVSAARLAAMFLDAGELLEVMVAEVGDALVQRTKRAAVRWEHQRRGVAGFEPRERIEERAQRIRVGGGWKYADVGRDRREHLVAADEDAVLGVVQAQVSATVARRLYHLPRHASGHAGLAVDGRMRQ